jgi:predicted O-methyltransferase YrrM
VRLCLNASKIAAELEARYGPAPAPPPARKLQLLPYQLAALYHLARALDAPGARFLEIGTGHGASGYILAKAAPRAEVLSVTTSPAEAAAATAFWQAHGCGRIYACPVASWDLLERTAADPVPLDLVFVDGDHNRIARDLPWFNRLRPGGLFLCHDYSPQDSRSPSAIVYAELNRVSGQLERIFDVLLEDEHKIGMAGFYRREGEVL